MSVIGKRVMVTENGESFTGELERFYEFRLRDIQVLKAIVVKEDGQLTEVYPNHVRILKENDREKPAKMIYEYDGYSDGEPVYDTAHCPSCDLYFLDTDALWNNAKYCPECGQRLEW